MEGEASRPAVGYLLLPVPPDGAPPDLARCCDLLGERAPTIEPDPPAGAWFALRDGKKAPSLERRGAGLLALLDREGFPGARLVFAPTPGSARLLARAGGAPLAIVGPGDLPATLAPLPVEALDLDSDAADRLRLVGLHTLGAVAALSRGALGDYLGALGAAIEALARGQDGRPLSPRRPDLVLRARRDLDWPLADRGALAALLARLAAPQLAQLTHRGLGVTRAALTLGIEGERVRLRVRLPAPTTSTPSLVAALLAEADEALAGLAARGGDDATEAAPGITSVALALTAPRPLPVRQASFFDVPQGRAGLVLAGLERARRRADSPIGYIRPRDPTDPRPERRYALDPLARPPEAAT